MFSQKVLKYDIFNKSIPSILSNTVQKQLFECNGTGYTVNGEDFRNESRSTLVDGTLHACRNGRNNVENNEALRGSDGR